MLQKIFIKLLFIFSIGFFVNSHASTVQERINDYLNASESEFECFRFPGSSADDSEFFDQNISAGYSSDEDSVENEQYDYDIQEMNRRENERFRQNILNQRRRNH